MKSWLPVCDQASEVSAKRQNVVISFIVIEKKTGQVVEVILRKTPQIITIILIAVLFTSTSLTFTSASEPLWGIDIGDTINYDLNYVEIDYSFPPVNYNATGITFE